MATSNATSTTTIPETTGIPGFFKRLTDFEANVVSGIIGGFVFLIGILLAFWAWTKRKAEKRHFDHKIHGEMDKSISVTSDVAEAYTVNPLVQNMLHHTESPSAPGTKQNDSSGEKAAKDATTKPVGKTLPSCDPRNLARV